MSTDRIDYIVFGVRLDAHAITEEHRDQIENDGKFDVIFDGMGGEYLVVGKILAKSDIYMGFEFTDISAICPPNPDEIHESLEAILQLELSPLTTMVFSHYY